MLSMQVGEVRRALHPRAVNTMEYAHVVVINISQSVSAKPVATLNVAVVVRDRPPLSQVHPLVGMLPLQVLTHARLESDNATEWARCARLGAGVARHSELLQSVTQGCTAGWYVSGRYKGDKRGSSTTEVGQTRQSIRRAASGPLKLMLTTITRP